MMRAMAGLVVGALFASSAAAWDVRESQDEMTGKKLVSASVDSTNVANFGWPYQGDTRGWLMVRKHPRFGQDVLFGIENGQIVCRASGCNVLVRFDDRPPVKFGAVGPEDHDPKMIFFTNTKKFVAELRKAKRVRVAVTVHREGEPMFEFDTSGFDLK